VDKNPLLPRIIGSANDTIRDGNEKIETNVYFGVILPTMLVAMVPAVTTFNAASLLHIAEEDHSEDKPYAKVSSYRI
jgi:hypothetical protein